MKSKYKPKAFVDYEFQKQLGKGSYGRVDLYRRTRDGVDVAIKTQNFQQMIRSNLSELDLLTRLNHPNIIHLEEFFIEGDLIYYVLPFGVDARILLKKGFPMQQNIFYFQLLDGLDFLHTNGYYHCDLKLDNILFRKENTSANAIISDLGLARSINIPPEPCMAYVYRPPEFLKMYRNRFDPEFRVYVDQPEDGRIGDIWAMALVLIQMMTGRELFIPWGNAKIDSVINYMNRFFENRELYFEQFRVPIEYRPLLLGMLEPDITRRSTTTQCLQYPLFQSFSQKPGTIVVNRGPVQPFQFTLQDMNPYEIFTKVYTNYCPGYPFSYWTYIMSLDLYYRIHSNRDDFTLFFLTCIMISAYFTRSTRGGDVMRQRLLEKYNNRQINDAVKTILDRIGGYLGTRTLYNLSVSIDTLNISFRQMLSPEYPYTDLDQFYENELLPYSQTNVLSLREKYNVTCREMNLNPVRQPSPPVSPSRLIRAESPKRLSPSKLLKTPTRSPSPARQSPLQLSSPEKVLSTRPSSFQLSPTQIPSLMEDVSFTRQRPSLRVSPRRVLPIRISPIQRQSPTRGTPTRQRQSPTQQSSPMEIPARQSPLRISPTTRFDIPLSFNLQTEEMDLKRQRSNGTPSSERQSPKRKRKGSPK